MSKRDFFWHYKSEETADEIIANLHLIQSFKPQYLAIVVPMVIEMNF